MGTKSSPDIMESYCLLPHSQQWTNHLYSISLDSRNYILYYFITEILAQNGLNFQSPPNDQYTHQQKFGVIPIFSCICLYVFMCVYITRTGQTAGPIFMKICTHNHLKARKKWFPQIFDTFFQGCQILFSQKKGPFCCFSTQVLT